MVALNRRDGREAWNVSLDVGNCFKCPISAAPLLADNLVITGQGGGDTGYRGYLTALDAHTGRFAWRFYVVPGPGEPGHESWTGDSWRNGGGAPWGTGSYDPALGLVYWTTGNPTPALSAASRDPGGNVGHAVDLYTAAIVAIDVVTGKLRWHYEVVPNDVWDYDAVAELMLLDRVVNGEKRQLIVHAGKSGVATVLDRTDGSFLHAFKFAELVTWMDRIDDHGDVAGRHEPVADRTTNICPGAGGAKSWNQSAYSPRTGMIYVPILEACSDYRADNSIPNLTQGEMPGFGGSATAAMPGGMKAYGHVDAFALDNGRRVWKYAPGTFTEASVLATAGDLLFSGDAIGDFFALDAHTGTKLWHFATGAGHRGSAITYAVDGRQYIATPTGMSTLIGGALRTFTGGATEFRNGSTLIAFALSADQ
jgi:alcohol dehydrogenase (cytochrome c)